MRDSASRVSVVALMPIPTTSKVSFQRLAPILAGAIVLVVGVWAFRPYPIGIYVDDGVYAILAKAIATGHGLRNLNLPGTPFATHFPPGFPLVLAALWRLNPNFPQNIPLFMLLQAVLLSATALGTYHFARRIFGWRPGVALGLALVATLSLPLMSLGAMLFSEVLALALVLPLLVRVEVFARRPASAIEAVLLGVLAGVIGLVRTQVALVVPAACVVLMLRRQWRAMSLFATGALLMLLPWQLWIASHDAGVQGLLRGYYGSYGAWLVRGVKAQGLHLLVATTRLNAAGIAGTIADRVAPWHIGDLRFIPAILAAAAVIFGGFRSWMRAPITALFALMYVGLVFVWPFVSSRFIWGLWPILLLLGAFGIAEAVGALRGDQRSVLRLLPIVATAVLVIGMAQAEYSAYRARAWSDSIQPTASLIGPLVRWVNRNSHAGDLLVADDEPLVYLFTGRQAMPLVPFTAAEYVKGRRIADDARELSDLLRLYPARYVVTVVPWHREVARTIASTKPATLREIQELPNGAAFEVERP